MVTDWRSTLGVMSDSTPEEVRAAYITRAAEAEAPGRFESVNRAFLAYCQERLDAKTACEGGGIMDDVLERAESWLGSFCEGLTHRLERTDRLVSALAAEVRALRKKVDVTCGYLSDRVELRWDDELIRVVTEWRDAALSARSGEDK